VHGGGKRSFTECAQALTYIGSVFDEVSPRLEQYLPSAEHLLFPFPTTAGSTAAPLLDKESGEHRSPPHSAWAPISEERRRDLVEEVVAWAKHPDTIDGDSVNASD
jgi:hypothetical protein